MKIILDYTDELIGSDTVPMEVVFRTAIEVSAKAKIPVSFKHGDYEVFVTAEQIPRERRA